MKKAIKIHKPDVATVSKRRKKNALFFRKKGQKKSASKSNAFFKIENRNEVANSQKIPTNQTQSSPTIPVKIKPLVVPTSTVVSKAEVKIPTEATPHVVEEKKVADQIVVTQKAKKQKTETPEVSYPKSPEEDPNFIALKSKVDTTAQAQKKHSPAVNLTENAGEAAPAPTNERTGTAQVSQVADMDKKEPKVFNAEAFKQILLKKIEEILPKDEEEADKFSEENKMSEVQTAASEKLATEKQSASGGIPEATASEPNTAAEPERKIATLKTPKTGARPAGLKASSAMPAPRPAAQITNPLSENPKATEAKIAENNLNESNMAKGKPEGKVSTFLSAKQTAQDHSAAAPQEFRKGENATLGGVQQKSEAKGEEQLEEMYGSRTNSLNEAAVKQIKTQTGSTKTRETVAAGIDLIYQGTKTKVTDILKDLDDTVKNDFEAAIVAAKINFELFVKKQMDAYKLERYGEWFDPRGWGTRLADAVVGLPEEVNIIFTVARLKYVKEMDIALTKISIFVANKLNEAQKEIAKGRADVQAYVDKQPASLRAFAQEKANEIQDSFDELNDEVSNKQTALVDNIAENYKKGLEAVDAQIEEMKEANRGLWDKVLDSIDGFLETIGKLRQAFADMLAAAQSVIPTILNDPLTFVGNLFEGIGTGFKNFKNNFKKHLIGGLFKWLSGALGPMNITIPEDIFSLKGIFNLVLQVLRLTWPDIRKKLVLTFGEKKVAFLEKTFDVIKIIVTKGISGIWEFMKDKFNDLKEKVIGAIQDFITIKIIQAGIEWLLSLLIPGAGFLKAIIAIKDFVVSFVESMLVLVPSITEAILALASGAKARVAGAIEAGLALIVPIIINLLARLLRIKGLVKKVQSILEKLRARVDKQIKLMIKKARTWLEKMWGKAKKGAQKIKDKIVGWWKARKKFKSTDGENHEIYFKGKRGKPDLMMASDPVSLVEWLKKEKPSEKQAIKCATDIEKLAKKSSDVKDLEIEANRKKVAEANEDILKKMDELGGYLAKIVGEGGLTEYTGKNEQYFPSINKGDLPSTVKIEKITAINVKGKKPKRSASPGAWAYIKGKEINNQKMTSYWVRMHLISELLGGPGGNENLVPGPKTVNSQMEKMSESLLKNNLAIENNGAKKVTPLMWVETKIAVKDKETEDGTLLKWGTSLKIKGGFYYPKNGEWAKNPKAIVNREFQIPIPQFAKSDDEQKNMSLDTSSLEDILAMNFSTQVTSVVREDFKNKLKKYYPNIISVKSQNIKLKSNFLSAITKDLGKTSPPIDLRSLSQNLETLNLI